MTYTKGIDVSAWQDNNYTVEKVNWQKAAQMGTQFVFMRAAYIYKKDEDYDYNNAESKRAGILRGAYHYPSYMLPAVAQAEFFWSIIEKDPGELPPVLDLEQVPGTALPNGYNWTVWARQYMTRLEELCGRKPIFYCNPNIILNVLQVKEGDWLTYYPLWIAHYGAQTPLYSPWNKWTFWQYSSTGDGYAHGMESKGLDMDWFNGSEQELKAFAGSGVVAPTLSLEEKVDRLWKSHPELW